MRPIQLILMPLFILCITSTIVIADEKKDDSNVFWDVITDPFSKKKIDDALDAIEDNLTDIVDSEKIDDMLFDISDKLDIDTRERDMVNKLKENLPDTVFTKSAAFAVESASDMMRATFISDKEMKELAEEDIAEMDLNQTIAKDIDQYYVDLQKIMKKIDLPDDLDVELDVKVYLSPFYYIFTRANGSIRVNSGILELLEDDNEVLFLMAHEIAHLKNKDHKGSYRKAHSMYALENAINMNGDIVGSMANGVLESVTSRMRKSRFQKDEEFEADKYAIEVLKKNGVDKKIAVDALKKLQYMNAPLLMMHPTGYERIKNIEDNL